MPPFLLIINVKHKQVHFTFSVSYKAAEKIKLLYFLYAKSHMFQVPTVCKENSIKSSLCALCILIDTG